MIFISHDSRDAELAEAFGRLLSSVSVGVLKSFRSSDRRGGQGIEYGVEWFPEIMDKLNKSSDVVCLLTSRSLDRPWILYEAGVAKGRLNAPVLGLALGIPLHVASTGPFAQFQNTDDEIDSITGLVLQLLKRVPNAEPDQEMVVHQVTIFKQRVQEVLARLDQNSNLEHQQETSDDGETAAKMFEEVKVMFKDLPSRIEARINRRIGELETRGVQKASHSEMLYTVDRLRLTHPKRHWGWLYLVSSLRDDYPWLYEQGMDIYRALSSASTSRSLSHSGTQRTGSSRAAILKRKFKDFSMLADFTVEVSRQLSAESPGWLYELSGFTTYYYERTIGDPLLDQRISAEDDEEDTTLER